VPIGEELMIDLEIPLMKMLPIGILE
jgi:hypothetical protein